jgi:hypothetical protein
MYRQTLTNTQEKVLIRIINRLTKRKMPLTSAIVTNLIEEIRRAFVKKN